MEEIFATKIKINEILNIKDFEIDLSETERKHLIITGKNGSGKTTLLREMKKSLSDPVTSEIINRAFQKNDAFSMYFGPNSEKIDILINKQSLKTEKFIIGKFLIIFFEAKRISELYSPSGVKKVNIKPYYFIEDKAGTEFIQHLVNLKVDSLFAEKEKEAEEAQKIDEWFLQFEEKLLEIFDAKGAKLQFDRKNYNFNIIEPGKTPYNLNQLSDGYSSILNIVSELIMRMEEHKTKSYDVQGIVLIDEIETHLHIDLQKKVLPFLTSFFPKIQFIVTTHSPFVITSIENAVVCDLEKKIVLDDLSGYSYKSIVEGYFDADNYSAVLKQKVKEFEELMGRVELSEDEDLKLRLLRKYLEDIPKFLSEELALKIQQIKLKNLKPKVHK